MSKRGKTINEIINKIGNKWSYILALFLSLVLALFFVFTVFKNEFVEHLEKNTIQIIDTARKNEKSGGSDVRLKSVRVNGELIPFSELNHGPDWVEMDSLLIAINPGNPTYIEYTGENIENIDIEFQKHNGSGIVAISDNGEIIGELDLYDPGWSEATFERSLGQVSIMAYPSYFLMIWGLCILIVFSCRYLLYHFDKKSIRWMVLLGLSLLLLDGVYYTTMGTVSSSVLGGLNLGLAAFWTTAECVRQKFGKNRIVSHGIIVVCVLAVAGLSWLSLEIGCDYSSEFGFFEIQPRYIILNILTIVVIINILTCFINKWWISTLITSILLLCISIANYYVIQFHSMPLSVNEIRNLGTAMGVIGSYEFKINRYIVYMILFFVFQSGFIAILKSIDMEMQYSWKQKIAKALVLCSISGGILYKGYWAENAVKSAKNIEYAWQDTFHKYGYVACSLDLIRQAIEVIQEPEGYSVERVVELASKLDQESDFATQTPDIILILNETFFDLRQVADIKTDQEFLPNWDSMVNAVKGYAVAPLMGGGTNCSEYELLTGNSLQLMPGITPFYVLDLVGANSIASNLEKLGYETLASHSESANSYNRLQSYPNIGFQSTRFDSEFKNKEYYGSRKYFETDLSLYKNVIEWYETMPVDKPRFMYLLTIQNHGDWNINNEADDIVHVENDFGTTTELLNEYLSCIKKSDEAWKYLTDYFEAVDRPVVVCMVGDHSPYMAAQIVDSNFSEAEKNIRTRGTPFAIWCNYEIDSQNLGYISMNYLVPTLFEVAGVEMPLYYKYMLGMRDTLPIVSSYGKYYDSEGTEYDYDEETEFTPLLNDYFYLEFNNLNKNERQQELFEP